MFTTLQARFNLFAVICIVTITAGIYANTLDNEFTNWDDMALVVNNTAIRSLDLDNIKKIFTYRPGATYQPIRNVSYAVDYALGGLDTFWFHVHNILLHVLASLLLYGLLLKVLPRIHGWNRFAGGGISPDLNVHIVAFTTALVFAIHPVNVESVTWLSSRKYVELSFFCFLSFLLFVSGSANGVVNPFRQVKTALMSLGAFAAAVLAVLSSPFGVFLPGLFFLFDYCREPALNPLVVIKKHFFHYLPLVVFVAVLFPMLWFALAGSFGGAAMAHYQGEFKYTLYTIFFVLFDYVRNLILPLWLNNRYVDYIFLSPFDIYKIPVAALGLGLVLAWVFWRVRKGVKLDLFCVGWFFIAWLPASNLIPISTKMADRYIYIAGVGFILWVIVYGFQLIKKKKAAIAAGCLGMLAVTGVLSALTYQRNQVWQNSETLWQDSIRKDPSSFVAHNNLGDALMLKGRTDDAIFHFKQALNYSPRAIKSLDNLGFVYNMTGDYEKASHYYLNYLRDNPGNMEMLQKIGDLMVKAGQLEKAEYYFKQVLEKEPENHRVLNGLGNIKLETGAYEQALAYYRQALASDGNNSILLFNYAMAFARLGSSHQAKKYFEETLSVAPGHLDALNSLGQYWEKKGEFDEAIANYEKAIQINPDFAEAYNNLGNALQEKKEMVRAEKAYQKAISLNSGYADAFFNYGILLEKDGRNEEAENCYQKAIQLKPDHVYALNNLGALYIRKKNYQAAVKILEKAAAKDPEYFDAQFNLGYAFSAIGDLDKATQHYQKAAILNPEDIQAIYNLGVVQAVAGKLDAAAGNFKKVLEMNPEYLEVQLDLGVALFKSGYYDESSKYLWQVLERDPDNIIAKGILKKIQKNEQ